MWGNVNDYLVLFLCLIHIGLWGRLMMIWFSYIQVALNHTSVTVLSLSRLKHHFLSATLTLLSTLYFHSLLTTLYTLRIYMLVPFHCIVRLSFLLIPLFCVIFKLDLLILHFYSSFQLLRFPLHVNWMIYPILLSVFCGF